MAPHQPQSEDVSSLPVSDLPVLQNEKEYTDEKHAVDDDEIVEKVDAYDKSSSLEDASAEYQKEGVEYVNGEPVIKDGHDVSNFLIDVRDDGDPSLTFRSIFFGTVFAGLGAALSQIYTFKPIQVGVSTVFLQLIIYGLGNAWAATFPRASWVKDTRFARLGPLFEFINPGPFGIKEHVVATLVANTASIGSSSIINFAVQRLFYDTKVHATTAVLATFSTACFGYGLVGLLRPLTVYPAEMVYWGNLSTISVFQALHYNNSDNAKRYKLFWIGFAAMLIYEVFPSYIFPFLNGINVVCLATQGAPAGAVNVITHLFGGSNSNEGLGFGAIGLDWQYIGSSSMTLPLLWQANFWFGLSVCYIAVMGIYYSNTWNSQAFPMLSTSLFAQNGTRYPQKYVFGPTFTLNQTKLDEVGLPALTGANAWANLVSNLAVGALFTHVLLFWGPYAIKAIKHSNAGTQPDRHYQAMKKYKEAPWWWYLILLILAFVAGLIVSLKGETTLPVWAYIIALLLGGIVTPFSTLLYARAGSGVGTAQLMKMVAGAVNPGKPVANLYFSMWSHDVVATSINLAADLKIGQYLKIPPRVMFLTQLWGTILGAVVNYVVMISVVEAQRDVLLDPVGTNVWSGQAPQSTNSAAVTWSLAKELYGPSGPYFIIPMSLLIGIGPTLIHYYVNKRWPKIGPLQVDQINLPLIYNYAQYVTVGVNSTVWSSVAVGIISQVWLRRYQTGWYRKYNYILGGALDGGAQFTIFILSFAVFGASGADKPFPTWWGNPGKGNIDYCNGNGVLQ